MCGGGFRSRDRACSAPAPASGGRLCEGETTEAEACSLHACPDNSVVDGNWGPWTLVTTCTVTCGPGTQSHTRSCSNPLPAHGGATCTGAAIEVLTCNYGACPIDGNWAIWSNFGSCSLTCGGGMKQRFRECTDPQPENNGALCSTTPLAENVTNVANEAGVRQALSEECNTQSCDPINGSWSAWTDVYSCSVTCDSGVQRRMRKCNEPPPQNGGVDCEPTESANTTINGVVAEYKTFVCTPGVPCPVHGVWTAWSAWPADCDVTCGTGIRLRTRTCSIPQHGGLPCDGVSSETQDCVLPSCYINGAWAPWEAWGDCSASCGGGERTHYRTCTAPAPSGNGFNCTGDETAVESCNTQACPPLDGGWSLWVEWGPCSKDCGGIGVRARLRTCDNPVPERDGADCDGEVMDIGECDLEPCIGNQMDGNWGLWGPWNVCSAPCGGGTSNRMRLCNSPPPSSDGAPCEQEKNRGPLWFPTQYLAVVNELKICNEQNCAIDGAWGAWTSWMACTKSCSGGSRRRFKKCDNPQAQYGGRACPFASPFSDTVMQSGDCNMKRCPTASNLTTDAPLTTSTQAKRFCPGVPAHDKLMWPRSEVGTYAYLLCPTPSVGSAYRKCEAENKWSKVDTTGCKTVDLEELNRKVTFASKALDNVTALTSAVNLARSTCTVDQITVSGTLMTCTRVLIKLMERGIPGDPILDTSMVKHLYGMVLDTANEILDIRLKELWNSIIVRELDDEVSTLTDIPGALLTMTSDMGIFLRATHGNGFVIVRSNLEASVEPITCETINYRYPPKGPTPTPPSKHVRGGWVPPPEPHTTRFEPSDAFWKEPSCYSRRKKRQVSGLGSVNNTKTTETMSTKYPVTVIYKTLHHLLPDIDKMPYNAAPIGKTDKYIPVEDMHVVIAKVVSATIVGRTGLMNQSVGINIRFYHEKEGREPICASLDTLKRNVEYDATACNMTQTTINYTICDCSGADSTFVLLMKPGIIRKNVTYTVMPDVFLEYACYIGVVVHLIVILVLLFLGLWNVDRHWVVINFCLSTILYEFFVVIGRRWVNDDNICYLMVWIVHYGTMVNVSWVLGLCALCFKQLLKPQSLRPLHRFYYVLICWGIPLFIATIPTGLRHGYVIRDYFCWLSTDEYTNLAFIIPVVVISVLAIIILSVTFRMSSSAEMIDKLLDETSDLSTRRRFVKVLFAFVIIVLFTLMFLGANVGIGFLVGDLAQCLFVALIFVVLNEDVQESFSTKRSSVEEFIRLKKEMQEQGPDLEMPQHDDDPEWARQTNSVLLPEPTPPSPIPYTLPPINEMDALEMAKEARRERRRQKKKTHQEKPVYVSRLEPTGYQPRFPVNERAAAYTTADTPREQAERPTTVRTIPTRQRRTKSRQIRMS